MQFEDIKNYIIENAKNSRIYPKKLINDNISIINNYYNIELNSLNIGQIGKIIKFDLNPVCACGKLKKWDKSILQKSCGETNCRNIQREETLQIKYNVSNIMHLKSTKDKIEETCLKKYDSKHYLSSNQLKEQYKNNLIKTWYNKHLINLENCNKEYIEQNFLNDDKTINHELFLTYFNIKSLSTIYIILKKLNIDYKVVSGRSKYEDQISDYLSSITPNQILNNSKILKQSESEIDIYLPNNNIGIEFDGLYWHSFGLNNVSPKQFDKNYQTYRHINKTKAFEELDSNNKLFQIFENEWVDETKQNIWKSMLNNSLGLSSKIYARKCIIKEIPSQTANKFIYENHIQGIRNCKVRLGLYHNDELVSVMTFSQPLSKNTNCEYELIRFCNKTYTNVIGAASKLLKYFENVYQPKSLVTYANRRWSQGKLYSKLNFEFIGETTPNKFIINSANNKLMNRINFQKHKLQDKLEIFDENISADENIINNDYRIIWDCGNYIYKKFYK